MAFPPLGKTATKAQALAYLSAVFGSYRYGNAKATPYQGMTAAGVYAYIEAQNPRAAPYLIAVDVSDLMASSALAKTVGAGAVATGGAVNAIGTGVTQGLKQFAGGPFGSLESFLGLLETPAVWLRAAEGVIGVLLILTAVSKSVSAGSAVGKAARLVPLIA
jgi:hypothetical protein